MARQRDPGPRTAGRRQLIERLLREREESGETYHQLEERSGIPAPTLAWWQRRLRDGKPKQIELVEVAQGGIGLSTVFEVALPDGVVLRIPPSFDPGSLATVLELLTARC